MLYFKNLMMALMGRNPFPEELEQITEQYEKTAEKVRELNDLYDKSVESIERLTAQVGDYETLVENLRQRIDEKEDVITELSAEKNRLVRKLRDSIDEMISKNKELIEAHKKNNTLTEELITAKNERVAANKELIAANKELIAAYEEIVNNRKKIKALEKTGNSLPDLCSAMDSGDEAKMKIAVEYLGWNPYLARIAQRHLEVLRSASWQG